MQREGPFGSNEHADPVAESLSTEDIARPQ